MFLFGKHVSHQSIPVPDITK